MKAHAHMRAVSTRNPQRGRRLWLVTSWLIARLWYGLEMSRLAIFRMLPQARITHVSRQRLLLPPTSWVCDQPRHYCLTFRPPPERIVIVELPPISTN